MLGVPPVVSTVTASLNVSATSTVSSAVQALSAPNSLNAGESVMVGASAPWVPDPVCCTVLLEGKASLVTISSPPKMSVKLTTTLIFLPASDAASV